MAAQIFQFPARGRFAATDPREQTTPAANFSTSRIAKVVFGNAWYHEEAVDAERGDKK